MDNLILSVNIVLPLFLIMGFGYMIRKFGFLDDRSLEKMNGMIFRTILPILLFSNIYSADLGRAFNGKLIIFSVASIAGLYLVLSLLIPLIEKENKSRSVLIQGIFRSNFIIFGIPVCIALYGENGAGTTSILIAIVVPLYNILAVTVLEKYREERGSLKSVLKGILTNPLILGAAAGLAFKGLGIVLPFAVEKTVTEIAKTGTPLALMILGGSFKFSELSGNFKNLMIGVGGKILFVPMLFIPLSICMGFRGIELMSLIAMFGAPTAVSSFTMAKQMDANGELAGQIVVFTTLFSVVTMFLAIFTVKQLGYI
ncbi:MAG: AEC family transporter [Eubacteriaceae bacterium]|nr:AEC family transporter [Eubacteriaceae bacterium]